MERTYTEAEVIAAANAGAGELFGRNTLAATALAGEIAMKLIAGCETEEQDATPEAIDWNAPPDYARRAIYATSAKELADLIADGANRLNKSVASYCNSFYTRPEEAQGSIALSPYIFADGSTGDNMVGELHINVSPGDGSYRPITSLHLKGGEDSPYDSLADVKAPSYLSRSLAIAQTTVRDPVTGQRLPMYYPEVTVRYNGNMFEGKNGELFKAEYGKPIEAYGHAVITDLFWALDMAVVYYEEVYGAGIKHSGLTYADYREAGCLKDDRTLDDAKAEAYIRSHMEDESVERSGGWPVLRKWQNTKVTMDPDAREKVKEYKDRLRPTIAVTHPGLVRVS